MTMQSDFPPASSRDSLVLFVSAAAVLLVALLFGGGGQPYPRPALVAELVGLGGLGIGLLWPGRQPLPGGWIWPAALAIFAAAIPLIQLIPLPASIWSALPGRIFVTTLAPLAGFDEAPMPLSLDPEATRRTALAMIPGFATFVLVLRLDSHDRQRLVRLFLVFALVSAALCALQFSTRSAAAYPFHTAHFGNGVGFFANRNHQATLLAIAIIASALGLPGMIRARKGRMGAMITAVILLFLVAAVISTTSRTGLILAPAALIGWFLIRDKSVLPPLMRSRVVRIGALLAIVAALLFAALDNAVIARVISRFDLVGRDDRPIYWHNTFLAAKSYLPAGSGLGTFRQIYGSVEPLNTVRPSYVNHAHNDYLELLLETGIFGIVGILLFVSFVVIAGIRALRAEAGRDRQLAGFALGAILLLLAHSLVDYPLRTLSMIAVLGMCAALLLPAVSERYHPSDHP